VQKESDTGIVFHTQLRAQSNEPEKSHGKCFGMNTAETKGHEVDRVKHGAAAPVVAIKWKSGRSDNRLNQHGFAVIASVSEFF